MKDKIISSIVLLNLAFAILLTLPHKVQTKIPGKVSSPEKCCQRIFQKVFVFDIFKDGTESQEQTIDSCAFLHKKFYYNNSNPIFFFTLKSFIHSQTEYIEQFSRPPPFF